MMRFKKTALALWIAGVSSSFAGTMGPVCTADNVTIPCHRTGWDFGAYALYLKPSYGGTLYDNYFTDSSGATQFREFDLDWGWGFKLEGAYHFGSGNDLNINWSHIDKETGAMILTGTAAAPVASSSTADIKWDAVNAEYGQHVDYGDLQNIRFHGGVQYARIGNNIHRVFNGALVGADDLHLKFNGFGPRVGIDFSRDWGNGVAVYAKAAGSLLVGSSDFNYAFTGAGPSVLQAGKTTVVPELDGKLGLKYTYVMANGDLDLDLGYLWQNYINALHTVTIVQGQDLGSSGDFTLHGPYIGLKYMGYV